jgi:hypothetical protein
VIHLIYKIQQIFEVINETSENNFPFRLNYHILLYFELKILEKIKFEYGLNFKSVRTDERLVLDLP